MSLCLIAGGKTVVYALTAFTLAWTHTVERTAWQEDWRVTADGLVLVEARIKGSGAGMEPGDDARFDGTWWRYSPALPPQPRLILARSAAGASGWALCANAGCTALDETSGGGEPVVLRPCAQP